jgi:hypothetical protein
VAELVRQRDGEDVERPQRQVLLEREGRDAALAHPLLEVDPRCVGALRERRRTRVEDLVEDLDALVRLADLVGVGVAEEPAHVHAPPVPHDHVVLAADVLGGLADIREQRLEDLEDRGGVGARAPRGAPHAPTAPAAARRRARREGSEHVGPPIGPSRVPPTRRCPARGARAASDPQLPAAVRRGCAAGPPDPPSLPAGPSSPWGPASRLPWASGARGSPPEGRAQRRRWFTLSSRPVIVIQLISEVPP